MAKDMIAQPVFFSRKEAVEGAYVKDGRIVYGVEYPRDICAVEDVYIPGRTIWKTRWRRSRWPLTPRYPWT